MSPQIGKNLSAFQLSRRFRWTLYAVFAILFATGALWLIADQLKDSARGDFWQETSANLLMVHGGAAMVTLLLLGALFPTHVARAWRSRLNRVLGATMVLCNGVLIITAFGLYYFGSDTLRPWAGDVHIVVGFALPPILGLHIWLGRRQARSRSILPPVKKLAQELTEREDQQHRYASIADSSGDRN